MKKLKKIIKASFLCLKYPFLYPRNRWDGKHHAYLLNGKLYNLNKEAVYKFGITAKLIKDPIEHVIVDQDHTSTTYFEINSEKLVTHAEGHGITVNLDIENRKLVIKNHLETKEYDLKPLLWCSNDKFIILGMSCFWNNSKNITICVKTTDETDKTNYGFRYDFVELLNNKRKLRYYKILKWIDLNILDKLCFLPTYTELDAMPSGWRKAFGIPLCKELKNELRKHKYLRKYRITQIKEKFGELRWYDYGNTENGYKIIEKYKQLSQKTCIDCGKPATKISCGYISPYCDDCATKNKYSNYISIIEEDAWDKAYTYYWPKDDEE